MKNIMIDYSRDRVLTTILPYIKDKEVLDLGCVEHALENKNKKRIWVHDFLRAHARHVVGIDILEKDIMLLKKQGYDVYYKSAETFTFNKKFDIIFAGELIEHLSNPGLFLKQSKRHLKKDGILVLTTPNAFNLRRVLECSLLYTNDPGVNNEHVCWYSPTVIKELLSRYNFHIKSISWVKYPLLNPSITHQLINLGAKILGSKFKETMIVIAK